MGGDEAISRTVAALVQQAGVSTRCVATGTDALSLTREAPPSVGVLGLELRDPSAYEVCRALREQFGEALPIAVVTSTRTEPHDKVSALLLGADEYFAMPFEDERFLAGIAGLVGDVQAAAGTGDDWRSPTEAPSASVDVPGIAICAPPRPPLA